MYLICVYAKIKGLDYRAAPHQRALRAADSLTPPTDLWPARMHHLAPRPPGCSFATIHYVGKKRFKQDYEPIQYIVEHRCLLSEKRSEPQCWFGSKSD